MMKSCSIIIFLAFSVNQVWAQQEKGYINKGNKLYQEQKFKEAEDNYRKSVEKKSGSLEGNFNLGDALYKQKNFSAATDQFTKIATTAPNKNVAAVAYHNLGNSLLADKKLEESIEAYKKSLIANPHDDQTRYNLAYAMEKLKEQKKQNKDNKNNKDQNKDQQNKDQNKKDQDKKDQDKKDQQNKDQQNKDQQNKDKKDQQNEPDKLSKEDAQRMLDALNNAEQNTQEKLKDKKLKGVKVRVAKDW